jgi:hypothetical protein
VVAAAEAAEAALGAGMVAVCATVAGAAEVAGGLVAEELVAGELVAGAAGVGVGVGVVVDVDVPQLLESSVRTSDGTVPPGQ